MSRAFKPLALAALCVAASQANALSVEVFAPPANLAYSGLSDHGQSIVGWTLPNATFPNSGNYVFDADRVPVYIGGASAYDGYAGNLNISANGRFISGTALVDSQYAQAAIYDRNAGNWTPLGSLSSGTGLAIGITGVKQQSIAYSLSADGSTVAGVSYLANGSYHAAVFRNGTVTDLTPAKTGSTKAVATSADGSVIGGYNDSNGVTGILWRWNAATGNYDSMTPTVINPATGSTGNSAHIDAISPNGLWAAGGSSVATGYGPPFAQPSNNFAQGSITNAVTGASLVIPYDHVIDTSQGNTDILRNMRSTVNGISDDGVVIGAYTICTGCNVATVQTDAWIYFASSGQTLSIDNYLAFSGQALTSTQHVYRVFSMSADGDSFSAAMFDSATQTTSALIIHGVTATAPVPEPGQWALMALGLPLLMLRRLRNRRAA